MATVTEKELTADQEFVKVWWEAETFREVFNLYRIRDEDKFAKKDDKQLRSMLKGWATKIRNAGVDMQYFEDRLSTKTVIDADEMNDFIDSLGVSKRDRRKAQDQKEEWREITVNRLAGRKKKAK